MTDCSYCARIRAVDPGYPAAAAAYDLGSEAPRCERHWRYVCAHCGDASHFMATAFCPDRRAFYCADCAKEREEIDEPFWAWTYTLRYRSPWTGQWQLALDRAEADGVHPLDDPERAGVARAAISSETYLNRYPEKLVQWWANDTFTDERVRTEWNSNADRWAARYDDDGDRNRRHLSDPVLFDVLGDPAGLRVLDAGSGNGYLARKLARRGAKVSGVEISDRFVEIARSAEAMDPLGVVYHRGSLASMPFLETASFDRVVSNYVLQDVLDIEGALKEITRVLCPGGVFVAVVFHPCFGAGPSGWIAPAKDSPRREDETAYRVNEYFRREPLYSQWGDLDPVLGFHRTLTDYWELFSTHGLRVSRIAEPTLTERAAEELSPSERLTMSRIAWSIVFRLENAGPPRETGA